MSIPDAWLGRSAKGLARRLYNIALHRLKPDAPPRTEQDFINLKRHDGRLFRVLLRATALKTGHSMALVPSIFENEVADSSSTVALFAIWRSNLCPLTDRVVHTWWIPATTVADMFSQEFAVPARADREGRNVRIVDMRKIRGGRWSADGAERKIDLTTFYDPWELDDEELRYASSEPPGPRKGEEPRFIVSDSTNRIEVESWVDVLVHSASRAVDLGLAIDKLPMKSSKDGNGLSDPRRVRDDLYIQTHGDADYLFKLASETLSKVGKLSGFFQIITDGERAINLPM